MNHLKHFKSDSGGNYCGNFQGNVTLESDLVGNVECLDGLTKTLLFLCPIPCVGVWDVFHLSTTRTNVLRFGRLRLCIV
jgi:hypothetical protein